MSNFDEEKERKYTAFAEYNFDADENWQSYLKNIESQDELSSTALLRYKKRYYKRSVDPSFDVEYIGKAVPRDNKKQSTSSSSSSTSNNNSSNNTSSNNQPQANMSMLQAFMTKSGIYSIISFLAALLTLLSLIVSMFNPLLAYSLYRQGVLLMSGLLAYEFVSSNGVRCFVIYFNKYFLLTRVVFFTAQLFNFFKNSI